MELVAILLIPIFLKAADSDALKSKRETDDDDEEEVVDVLEEEPPNHLKRLGHQALPEGIVPTPPGLIGYVLKMILSDVSQLELLLKLRGGAG